MIAMSLRVYIEPSCIIEYYGEPEWSTKAYSNGYFLKWDITKDIYLIERHGISFINNQSEELLNYMNSIQQFHLIYQLETIDITEKFMTKNELFDTYIKPLYKNKQPSELIKYSLYY